MRIFGLEIGGSKEAKVAAALGAVVAGEMVMAKDAMAGAKHHEKTDGRSAVVERHEATGMNAAIAFALEKASEGKDEMTGTITEGSNTVSFERKDGKLVAHITYEEGGKTETKNILIGETKTGTDENSNNKYKKISLGDADELDEIARLSERFKEMEARDDNENNRIASKE